MTYEQAMAKLKKFGQEQLLRYYEELDGEQQERLLKQIEKTDLDIVRYVNDRSDLPARGVISPLGAMEIPEIREKEDHFRHLGIEALRTGKVAAVLLAGGMGTRLGSEDPKCMYDIGITRPVYIMQRLIENMMDVVKETGVFFPLYVMTSEKNHEATVRFMQEHCSFGYQEDRITYFMQDMAPAADRTGKVYLEAKDRIATSPNGNGGWFHSLAGAGLIDQLHRQGVEWINVFSVDNVLQRIADPVFIGATLESGAAAGAKVVKKVSPDERVGAICLEDGRPSIVEYYDMTPALKAAVNEKGEPAYNFGVTLNYLFREKDLEELIDAKIPLHIVEKKIPYLDEAGEPVKPEEPNGFKFELLVLDLIHEMKGCLPFEVIREKEFAPIKNKEGADSPDSARELCRLNGIEL